MEDQIYTYHAEMCKVFSHAKRLELINILRDKEMSAGELGKRLGLTPALISLSRYHYWQHSLQPGAVFQPVPGSQLGKQS